VLCYIPIDRLGANLFFQLISRRYEKGAMIMTSNQPFSNWEEVSGDQIIASAILDRGCCTTQSLSASKAKAIV